MRNILFVSILIIVIVGCKPKKVKPDVSYHYFEPWRLEYFSYQLGDTLSFTNEANSQVLHYTCTKFDRYLETTGDTNECTSDMEFCSVHATEMIKIELTCAEDNNYNFFIYNAALSSYLSFSMRGYTGNELLSSFIQKDSICGLASTIYPPSPVPNVECLGTTAKLFDKYNANQSLDTLYYSKQEGIIKFSTPSGSWNKN